MTIRSLVKSAIEFGLAESGAVALFRRIHRADAVILAYHNVVDDDSPASGDVPLHVRRGDFIMHLDSLEQTHDIVALDALISGAPGGRSRPRAALTFDDAYHGAVTIALPEISRRGHPATVFVAPGFLDGGVFWWDALAAPDGGGLDPQARIVVLDHLNGSTERARAWALSENRPWNVALPESHRCVSLARLQAAASASIAVGSHTWFHSNLTVLDDATLREELARPLSWLRERFRTVSSVMCYPYGLHNARVEEMAKGEGYTGGLRVEGGPLRATRAYSAPRVSIPSGVSRRGFVLRSAGLFHG